MDKNINLFISHYHSDADKIENLKSLLAKKNNEVRDSSIYEAKAKNSANNEDYIKTLIRPQINWAGTVVVLIGEKTSTSNWVNWEIEYAAQNGKRIVGVYLQGAKDEDIPKAFKDHGDALVAWNADKINKAVNGDDSLWEDSEGKERREPLTALSRAQC